MSLPPAPVGLRTVSDQAKIAELEQRVLNLEQRRDRTRAILLALVAWPVGWISYLRSLERLPCTCATSAERCPRHG